MPPACLRLAQCSALRLSAQALQHPQPLTVSLHHSERAARRHRRQLRQATQARSHAAQPDPSRSASSSHLNAAQRSRTDSAHQVQAGNLSPLQHAGQWSRAAGLSALAWFAGKYIAFLTGTWAVKLKALMSVAKAAKVAKLGFIAAAPFAAANTQDLALDSIELFGVLNDAVYEFVNWYLLILFFRVVFCWFPTFEWDRQPWKLLRQVTDPYLNVFTGLVPPLMGALDLTPLLGFFVLQWVTGFLSTNIADSIDNYW